VQVVLEGDHGLRQRPAASSRPRAVVDVERLTEARSCLRVEDGPGNLHVAGGIADDRAAPVEDTGDLTVTAGFSTFIGATAFKTTYDSLNIKTGEVVAPPCMIPVKTYRTVVENGKVFIEV